MTGDAQIREGCVPQQDTNPSRGEVFIYPQHEWWNNIVRIQAVDATRRLISLEKDCSYEIKPGVTFQFPQPGDGNYHEGMTNTFYIRVTLSRDTGTLWIDDVELRAATMLSEWEAWQAEGWDRNSIVADPLFENAAREDYRLRKESPAWELGFKPIPVDAIGCYPDLLRASWPLEDT